MSNGKTKDHESQNESENRDADFRHVWAAIRSAREQLDNYIIKNNHRLSRVEAWREIQIKNHLEMHADLTEIKLSLHNLLIENAERRGAEKSEKRMLALMSALGSSGLTSGALVVANMTGLL